MKKHIIAIFIASLLSLAVQAQQNSFGLRTELMGGTPYAGFSYQHTFGEKWQMELDAITSLNSQFHNLSLIGLAQYRPRLVGNLYGLLGLGVEVGFIDMTHNNETVSHHVSPMVVGQIGLLYSIKNIPIDITFDMRIKQWIASDGQIHPMLAAPGICISFRPPKPHKPEPKYQRTQYTLVAYDTPIAAE